MRPTDASTAKDQIDAYCIEDNKDSSSPCFDELELHNRDRSQSYSVIRLLLADDQPGMTKTIQNLLL